MKNGNKKWEESVPISSLMDIYLVSKKYVWRMAENKSLHRWLFEYLQEKGEKVVGEIEVLLGRCNGNRVASYYLQSDIFDENIILSTQKKKHEIKSYEVFKWLNERYLYINF
jgi:hypothetical protein